MPKTAAAETKLKYVSPDVLNFDPGNPRFAGRFEGYTQDQIQEEICKEPFYALELVDSLVENGFIDYEPLVVKQHGQRFTVIEGNRRLAAISETRRSGNSRLGPSRTGIEQRSAAYAQGYGVPGRTEDRGG